MNNLKEIRNKKGISQLRLSILTGMPQPLISQIENNLFIPYPGWRKRLSKALKVTERELFQEEGNNGK